MDHRSTGQLDGGPSSNGAIVLVSAPLMALAPSTDRTPPGAPANLLRVIRDDGVDPSFRSALDVGAVLHRHLVRARVVSARMVTLQRSEQIGFHSASVGDEAAIVGAAIAAREADWIFPGAREWYAGLARGMPIATYVHHAFGSAEDPAKGHSAPDHAPARAWNVVPPSGIPGAHLPQAVGAAWAAKIRKERTATLALFGAEVVESGDFHNALNFAGVVKAPVVLLGRAPANRSRRVADRAVAYGVASAHVDGSDVLAVYSVVREALARADEGRGATLIEVTTPTLPGLAGLGDAAFAAGDVLELGDDDPIVRLRRVLLREKRLELGAQESILQETSAELDAAVAAAERIGPPAKATIFDHVYSTVPPHLEAQRQNLIGGQS